MSNDVLARIARDRGGYPQAHADVAEWDERVVELFHDNYMHILHGDGPLEPKFRELILVAVDAATYYHGGTRTHIRDALAKGATPREVFETLKVASLAGGMHVLLSGIAQLKAVLSERECDGER